MSRHALRQCSANTAGVIIEHALSLHSREAIGAESDALSGAKCMAGGSVPGPQALPAVGCSPAGVDPHAVQL